MFAPSHNNYSLLLHFEKMKYFKIAYSQTTSITARTEVCVTLDVNV
uniref:Uncharacterized protein n=1 Tax=Anguilla anguilla TaxID=7936 RepID=A0A0E9SQG5_ANGAN